MIKKDRRGPIVLDFIVLLFGFGFSVLQQPYLATRHSLVGKIGGSSLLRRVGNRPGRGGCAGFVTVELAPPAWTAAVIAAGLVASSQCNCRYSLDGRRVGITCADRLARAGELSWRAWQAAPGPLGREEDAVSQRLFGLNV